MTDKKISPVVRAANRMTARWCGLLHGEDVALSGAGARELCGEAQVRPAAESDSGRFGLTVRRIESWEPQHVLSVELPSFEIKAGSTARSGRSWPDE